MYGRDSVPRAAREGCSRPNRLHQGIGVSLPRVSAKGIEHSSESTFGIGAEVDDLAAMLRSLTVIAPLELPDWRAVYAINSAVNSFSSMEANLRAVPSMERTTHERRMRFIEAIVHALEFSEDLVRDCLLERGSDVDPIRHTHNGVPIKSLSYSGPDQ
jgi:hypothetical protein